MAFTYTTLAADTFQRANENPVNPAVWSDDSADSIAACQIVSDELEPTAAESIAVYTGITWPANQWAQYQVDACQFSDDDDYASTLLVMSRGAGKDNGYVFEVDGPLGPNCNVAIFSEINGTVTMLLGSGDGGPGSGDAVIALYAGDSIRMELFNGTLAAYVIHEGVKTQVLAPTAVSPVTLGSGPLHNGSVAIDLFEDTQASDAQVSNFQGGLMSVATVYKDIPPGPNQELQQQLQTIEFAVGAIANSSASKSYTADEIEAAGAEVSNDSTLMTAIAAAVANRTPDAG